MDPPRRGLESRRRRRGGVERLQQDLGSKRNSVTKGQSAIRDLFGVKHDREATFLPSRRSSPISLRLSSGSRRVASTNLSWRAGGCRVRLSTAANRSPTSATSGARIGADG